MKHVFALTLGTMLFALCAPVQAQQPKRVPRIGYLGGPSSSAVSARIEAFRQGLHELGYGSGKTLSLSIDMQRENSTTYPRLRQS